MNELKTSVEMLLSWNVVSLKDVAYLKKMTTVMLLKLWSWLKVSLMDIDY